ncbi:putative damage-inducible protein DinB [Catalinimonas alkaloidigena]|uniref:DinB family protein n=1 Tax=Catalinimonas alkaloidigena TaxID=1075417 RepID=UPI0024056194|nr:DinB family protein [Catalinimonas alkaloidigena]MDF9799591.1 putative damage-inducible protein DinB [Catalinimonas alkaloidigena]
MKRTFLVALILSVLFLPEGFAQTEIALENEFADDFYPVWQRAGEYLLEVAEAMPAELYAYQPTEEIFTFAEQLMHTAANIYFLNATYIQDEDMADFDLEAEGKSKEEIMQILREAIATVDTSYHALAAGEENEPVNLFNRIETNKKRVLMLMRDHMTHHRGQLVIYLRMNGIQPPAYVGW